MEVSRFEVGMCWDIFSGMGVGKMLVIFLMLCFKLFGFLFFDYVILFYFVCMLFLF